MQHEFEWIQWQVTNICGTSGSTTNQRFLEDIAPASAMPCLDMPRQKVVPGPGCLVSLQFCSWHTKQIHAMCFEFAPGAWFLLPCCITCSSLPLYELGKLDFDPLGSDSIRFQHVDAVTSPWCFWIGAIWALLLVFLGKATGPTWTKSPGAIDAGSPEPTPWAVVWWSISDGYMMINGII